MGIEPERRFFSDSDGMLGSLCGEHGHELRIFVTFTNISCRQVGVNVKPWPPGPAAVTPLPSQTATGDEVASGDAPPQETEVVSGGMDAQMAEGDPLPPE